jgi:hypothetical protein
MKFLINEVKKKTKTGWKWLCKVFMIDNVWDIRDITEQFSIRTYLSPQYDWANLTINYGSWTGIMVISELIKKYYFTDAEIIDVSVFNS